MTKRSWMIKWEQDEMLIEKEREKRQKATEKRVASPPPGGGWGWICQPEGSNADLNPQGWRAVFSFEIHSSIIFLFRFRFRKVQGLFDLDPAGSSWQDRAFFGLFISLLQILFSSARRLSIGSRSCRIAEVGSPPTLPAGDPNEGQLLYAPFVWQLVQCRITINKQTSIKYNCYYC